MPLTWLDVENADAAYDAAAEACARALGRGRRPLAVVPAFEDVASAKKALSERGASFGVGVEFLDGWVSDLWELCGDGRRFVSNVERLSWCARLLQESGSLIVSAGMTRLLSDVVELALPEALAADLAAECLSENEVALLGLARAYDELLSEEGCIEACAAVRLLPDEAWDTYDAFALGFVLGELSPMQAFALDRAHAVAFRDLRVRARQGARTRAGELERLLAALYRPDPAAPVAPEGALRFAFPSGKGAELRLVSDLVAKHAHEHPGGVVVVASARPLALFEDLVRDPSLSGVALEYEGAVPFAKSDAGRLVFQLCDAIGLTPGARADVRAAADLVLNPLLGFKPSRAFSLAREWRGNRLITADELICSLREKLPKGARPVVEAVRERKLARALSELSKFAASRTHLPEAYRARELSALSAASVLAVEAEARGVRPRLLLELLEGVSGGASVRSEGQSPAACVRVMSLQLASRLAPASCDVLIACEMNASERPVRAEESSRRTLLAKLGVPDASDSLARVRRTYYDAVSAARALLVLERSLHAGDAEPLYPATLFEETVDCYRAFDGAGPAAQPEGLVEPYAVTASLVPLASTASEADFLLAATGCAKRDSFLADVLPPQGAVSSDSAELIVLPRSRQLAQLPGLDLSPSAIESYLECPHRWFVQRRLALGAPDEGFGALERGTFVHGVLEAFYLSLKEAGHERVTRENVQVATALLEEAFDVRLSRQFEKDPGQRYVPSTRWEEEGLATLKRKLSAYVGAEPAFLSGFAPAYFELDFGISQSCGYAGHRLRGTIDRVDVDAEGNAVVIDYKTSLSKDYDAHEKDPDFSNGLPLPRKMQALIYAKVLRDGLGVDLTGGPAVNRVVGALYVNPLTREVRGSYDACVLGPELIPGIIPSRAAVPFGRVASFDALLDEAEGMVARRLEGLVAGDIRPKPYGKAVCSYCPSMLCERRLS